MKQLSFSIITSIFFAFSIGSKASAEEQIHHVSPKEFHLQSLSEDSPLVDLAFDHKKEGLWLLGQKSLWHWDYVQQRLQRYQLRESTSLGNQLTADKLIAIDSQPYLAAAAGSRLFLISQSPFKVTEYQVPDKDDGDTIAVTLNSDQECCLWVHSHGVFQIQPSKAKLEKIASFSHEKSKRLGAVIWYHQIWSISERKLFVLDLFTGEEREVYASKEPLKSVHIGHNQDIILVTNQALLRLQASGQIVQIIPQRHTEPLVSVDFNPYTHNFFFQDGLLERYHMPFQHLESHMLANESNTRFEQAISSGPFLATIRENIPSVFIIGAP